MSKSQRDSYNQPIAQAGYTIHVVKQNYTSTLSNYYVAPKIDLSQTMKRIIFHSPAVSQTSMVEYKESTFSYIKTNSIHYSALTKNSLLFHSYVYPNIRLTVKTNSIKQL